MGRLPDGEGQPLPTQHSCVIPVAACDALAWVAGKLSDADLLARAPLIPEAVFIVNLPNREAYKSALRQVQYWRERGAIFLISRTGTPCVDRHLVEKNGSMRVFKEDTDPVKFRFLTPPEIFSRWCNKWGPRTPCPIVERPAEGKPEAIATPK